MLRQVYYSMILTMYTSMYFYQSRICKVLKTNTKTMITYRYESRLRKKLIIVKSEYNIAHVNLCHM